MSTPASSIPIAIRDRISAPAQPRVWTPEDFADLGPRTAVDQALHRLVASRKLRRIARGFYDTPQDNRLTGTDSLRFSPWRGRNIPSSKLPPERENRPYSFALD
jgi:hypothetical protein